MSLSAMFEPDPVPAVLRDGKKYDWRQLYSKNAVQEFAKDKVKTQNVEITDNPTGQYYGIGDLEECHEAWEYTDGTILMCCTTASFVDTFASHSRIAVIYVGLTPIEGKR